jgi:hypothetical protein
MLDRRKLAIPLFAQAGAFVVVLVIGGLTGHAAPKAPPGPGTTVSPGSSTSPVASKESAVKLSVKVTKDGSNGLSASGDDVSGSQVRVLQNGTLASVASGTLDSALEYATNVSAGQYQVCVNPPLGWGSVDHGTEALAGWVCSSADLRKGPQRVTFHLTPQIPSVGQ